MTTPGYLHAFQPKPRGAWHLVQHQEDRHAACDHRITIDPAHGRLMPHTTCCKRCLHATSFNPATVETNPQPAPIEKKPAATHEKPAPRRYERPSFTTEGVSARLSNGCHKEARNIAELLLNGHPSLHRSLHRSPLAILADTGEVNSRLLALLVAIGVNVHGHTGEERDAAGWLAGYCRVRIRSCQAWPVRNWPLCLSLEQPVERAWSHRKPTPRTLLERQRQPSLFS